MKTHSTWLVLLPALLACGCSGLDRARATETAATPVAVRPDREWSVGFVIVDGVYNTELTAPFDILHHSVFHADQALRVFTVAHDLEPVTSFEGLRLLPDYTFASAPAIDVLVVPSAEHSMDSDLDDAALIGFVRERGSGAHYVMSLCDGAFVLAQAGLLDGLEVTTFPADRERLAEMFPSLTVHHDARFVHDGRAITSVGGAPSFEPALYLAELLYGKRAADGIAKGLVIDWDLGQVPHRIAGPR
ncbi:DJ-1/PfpI family protein [Engelhardtia mirabilis]|uniref:Isonitrile hydratase n=1 Tax=Engelhardtia mirabilis TaxID=2528011 RepID=A0A518BHA7_9BACT|nr:Isonitrile hydratase [Planctomycetes bacterium Pla133]QDV00696.1 Isonitrile hydratase [Planctomycetes bacterium Pla86]